jgi:hypothetical protein
MNKKTTRPNYITVDVFERAISKLATKDDIKNMATKDDLKNFATKNDLSRLTMVVLRNTEDIQSIKREMATKSDIEKILSRIDHFVKKVAGFEQEEGVQSLHLIEVQEKVKDHEIRLTALESAR